MGSYGLTRGTRHYIQYDLTEGDGWKDLLFQDTDGEFKGLWCSRSYSAANARIEELMAECDTDRSQYRIVRRTWDETILEHNPTLVASATADNDKDPDVDQSAEDDADVTEVIETA